jgi:hypothetical protein
LSVSEVYEDSKLLDALQHARGDDRIFIALALGRSQGEQGPNRLRHLAEPASGERGHTRAQALDSLARRRGAADTPLYANYLRDRSLYVRFTALQVLADCGDERATSAVVDYLLRRLQSRRRNPEGGDYEDVRAALVFAVRNGALREVARVLKDCWRHLDQVERGWLVQCWPDLEEAASGGTRAFQAPDSGKLSEAILEAHRPPTNWTPELEAEFARIEDTYIEAALRRIERRARS